MKYSLILTLSYTLATTSAAPIFHIGHPVNAAINSGSVPGTTTAPPPATFNTDAHSRASWEHIAVLKNVHVNLGGLGSTSNDRHYKKRHDTVDGVVEHVNRPGPKTSVFRNGHRPHKRSPSSSSKSSSGGTGRVGRPSHVSRPGPKTSVFRNGHRTASSSTLLVPLAMQSENNHSHSNDNGDDKKRILEEEEEKKKSEQSTTGRIFKKLPVMPTEKINIKRDPLLLSELPVIPTEKINIKREPLLPKHQAKVNGEGRHFKNLPVEGKVIM